MLSSGITTARPGRVVHTAFKVEERGGDEESLLRFVPLAVNPRHYFHHFVVQGGGKGRKW